MGYAAVINAAWLNIYYIVILAWCLFYFLVSLSSGTVTFTNSFLSLSVYIKHTALASLLGRLYVHDGREIDTCSLGTATHRGARAAVNNRFD